MRRFSWRLKKGFRVLLRQEFRPDYPASSSSMKVWRLHWSLQSLKPTPTSWHNLPFVWVWRVDKTTLQQLRPWQYDNGDFTKLRCITVCQRMEIWLKSWKSWSETTLCLRKDQDLIPHIINFEYAAKMQDCAANSSGKVWRFDHKL